MLQMIKNAHGVTSQKVLIFPFKLIFVEKC